MFFALELIGHPIILGVGRKPWTDGRTDSDDHELFSRNLSILLPVSFTLTTHQSKDTPYLSTACRYIDIRVGHKLVQVLAEVS